MRVRVDDDVFSGLEGIFIEAKKNNEESSPLALGHTFAALPSIFKSTRLPCPRQHDYHFHCTHYSPAIDHAARSRSYGRREGPNSGTHRMTKSVDFSGGSQRTARPLRLGSNTALTFAVQVLTLAAGAVSIPITIRYLGSARFGLLSLAWVVVGYFSLFDMGLGQATTNYVAQFFGDEDSRKLRPLVWTSYALHLTFAILASLTLLVVTPVLVSRILTLPQELVPEARHVFGILAASLPIVFTAGVFRSALAGAQRFDLINLVQGPAGASAYILPVVTLPLGFSLEKVVICLVCARLAAAVGYFLLCLKVFPALRGVPSFDRALVWPLFGFGGWITVSSVISPVVVYLDRFLIGSLLSLTSVAYYAAPSEFVSRVQILPGALSVVLFPAFSTLSSRGEYAMQRRILTRALKYLLLVTGPVCLLSILFAPEILSVWLGPEFSRNGALPLRILAFGAFLNALAFAPMSFLQGVGRPDLPAKFHLTELAIHSVMAFLLISRFGIVGAACAWALRAGLDTALLWGAAWKVSQLKLSDLATEGLGWTVGALGVLSWLPLAVALVGGSAHVRIVSACVAAPVFAIVGWHYVLTAGEKTRITARFNQVLRWALPAEG